MTPVEMRNKGAAEATVRALKARHFGAYYAENKEEALSLALSLIPEDDTVSFGGSATVDAIGIKEALYDRGQKMIDRSMAKSPEEAQEMQRRALLCDTYLMSANAISADGVLVNVDGNGNRVAALCYGPRQVIVVAGTNKITHDVPSAIMRAKYYASPVNAQRFDIGTPCKGSGLCSDCKCPDSICAEILVTRLCRKENRIKVIIVNEELGF